MSSYDFTDRAQSAISSAIELARGHAHSQITPIHLALALLTDAPSGAAAAPAAGPSQNGNDANGNKDSLFRSVLSKAGVQVQQFETGLRDALRKMPQQNPPPDEVTLSGLGGKVLREADKLKSNQHDSYIAQDHILLALLEVDGNLKSGTVGKLLAAAGLANLELLKQAITRARGARRIDSKASDAGFEALEKYTQDLTALAAEGKLDPVIGRDDEIRRVVRILSRRTKNNAVLIGEPGTGKTSIAEGLAQRIIDRDVPPNLLGRLLSLDVGALMAGAKYRGEYEERVKAVLNDIEKASETQPVVLFIDEMHLLMAGKGDSGMDAANLIKPMLARGKLRAIGATTLSEYRQYVEKDAALERRFQQVLVEEPDVNSTIAILRGLRDKYEVHHSVRILDSSLVQAALLAKRYLTNRRMPDSAIDLVDEACADVRVQRDTVPEEIDRLQRKKLQLEMAAHALEREKDAGSKEALANTKKELASIEDELQPKIAAHEAEKAKGDEINNTRIRIEELRQKANDAKRRHDVQAAADLEYYAIPEMMRRLEQLQAEERKRAEAEQEDPSSGSNVVRPEAIAQIVSRWTGIPAARMMEGEKQKLLKLEKLLSKEVVGQPEAVRAVAQAIRLSRSGLANPNKPSSFLLCGPSGTGKTLLSKCLCKQLFDDENAMLRIDASEYSEKHSVSRLLGAPPGYVGYEQAGLLTEWVRRRPYSVILVDEVEKADRAFIQLFLGILDDGRATDSQGRTVNFANCIVLFTTNAGSQWAMAEDGELSEVTKELIHKDIQTTFPPEFLNRLSGQCLFRKLSREDVHNIVSIRINEINRRIYANGRRMKIELDQGAIDYLASVGYHPTLGARPLARAIEAELLNPLSMLILRNQIRDGETIHVTFDAPHNKLEIQPNHPLDPDAADIEMETDDEGEMEDAFIEPLD